MTENPTAPAVEAASVTDRGLSEKRPENEDSMLCDPARRIFAVADGVGGAQAGEVASQTAIDVLTEAFTHHGSDEDIEDLMEIAIQRANDAIYKMSREQPRFAMMATTVVALHLNGLRATVGHVGDSRLYSMSPDGKLRRETDDHSLVEEEVRAGRMTPEQALNHPGRNVISRALGAEPSVEVDMRNFEVESGTIFLLCSDGITRHIPDEELSALLRSAQDLEKTCAEMKRVCYERGAEDNLTAVLVRVGGDASLHTTVTDEEPTIIRERPAVNTASAAADSDSAPTQDGSPSAHLRRPFDDARPRAEVAALSKSSETSLEGEPSSNVRPPARRSGMSAAGVLGALVLVAAAAAVAFYVGMMYERKGGSLLGGATAVDNRGAALNPTPAPVPSPTAESPDAAFDRMRAAVDRSPAAEADRMNVEAGGQPLSSDDPAFLYLYGRAMLLTDHQQTAVAAFDRAILKAGENMTPRNGELKIDARLAKVAAQLRGGDPAAAGDAARELDEVIRVPQQPQTGEGANANAQPTP